MTRKTGTARPAVLLLGNYRPSLTLARTLNRLGYRVIVGSNGCERACQYSNAVSQMWDHSQIGLNADRFVVELRALCAKTPDLKAIFPVAEEYVRLFAENGHALEGLPPVATMKAHLVNKCLDKPFMMRLAERCGVPTAEFATSSDGATLRKAVARVGFPMIVRPTDSTRRLNGKKALTITNSEAFSRAADECKLASRDLILQKKFKGRRHNIYFAAISGQMLRCLHAVIERNDNPDGTGLAVSGRTIPAHGPLVEQTRQLLGALDYTGIGCAQFLVNEESGESSFLEINPRIAGNHALPEHAGLGLGRFMLELALGDPVSKQPVFAPAGIRYAWTSGDLVGAKGAYLRGQVNAAAAFSWCWRALMCAFKADVHMVYDRTDPKPALMTLWQNLPRIARWRRPVMHQQQGTIYGENTGAGK